MYFGRELEENLVPEWRTQYLNYEQAKKKIKALHLALRNAHRVTPQTGGRFPLDDVAPCLDPLPFTHDDFSKRRSKLQQHYFSFDARGNDKRQGNQDSRPDLLRGQSFKVFPHSPAVSTLSRPQGTRKICLRAPSAPIIGLSYAEDVAESQLLLIPSARPEYHQCSGSIVGSPPYEPELPDPAITTSGLNGPLAIPEPRDGKRPSVPKTEVYCDSSETYHAGKGHERPNFLFPRCLFRSTGRSSLPQPKGKAPQSYLMRIFSTASVVPSEQEDIQSQGYRELDARQGDFFTLLDEELDKIERFYRMKEEEASRRLEVLRQQLHELRKRRILGVRAAKKSRRGRMGKVVKAIISAYSMTKTLFKHGAATHGRDKGFLHPTQDPSSRKSKQIEETAKATEYPAAPTRPRTNQDEYQQDYGRRNTINEYVSYKFARRNLKLALQEFYRGLELMESYALLNRTAFRKINKKYDKAVNARPAGRYMSEKVNKAHFVQSDIIEGHLVTVEDLYTQHFKRGDRKAAVGNLRTKIKPGDLSSSSFRNGLFVAGGAFFGIFGINEAFHRLQSPDHIISVQSSYLLQLYAAYFLAVLLFLLFTLNCMIWTKAKINYVFIFEYDTRHVLDWRQLAELPCFFLFLNGLSMWLNFRGSKTDGMYLFWPLGLILVTLLILCIPIPVLYSNTRKWWIYSNWRLLLAGFYPVEFRDFYLADIYCSETYTMSQIEVFFCLYIKGWDNPSRCDPYHSRLLGFITALPAIWRAVQCLRRYLDTRSWFPHLANCIKYGCIILNNVTLSLYRIDKAPKMRTLFIVVAAFNSLYCSFWDVAIDFSLGNMYAQYPGLRDRLGYRYPWVYYVTMISDIILRQQWILYAIFTHDLQYSASVSFLVGFAEVLRRGMWSLVRVENEHCNNVGKFRACRDIPLPYSLPGGSAQVACVGRDSWRDDAETKIASSSNLHPSLAETARNPFNIDIERASFVDTTCLLPPQHRLRTPGTSMTMGITPPRMGALHRAASAMSTAHAQESERKRPQVCGVDDYGEVEESSDEDEGIEVGSANVMDDAEDVDDEPDMREVQRIVTRNGDSKFLALDLGEKFAVESWRWGRGRKKRK